jgi:hypothetical protein
MNLSRRLGPYFQAFDFTREGRTMRYSRVVRGRRFSFSTRSPACILASSTSPVGLSPPATTDEASAILREMRR